MAHLRLRSDVCLVVEYDDCTPFGSPVRDRGNEVVRAAYAPVADYVRRHGDAGLIATSPRLLREVVDGEAFRRLAEPAADGTWRVRDEMLYPLAAQAPIRWLTALEQDSGRALRWDLPQSSWPPAHALIAALAGDGCDAADPRLYAGQRGMLADLRQRGMLDETVPQQPADLGLAGADLTFLGHNTVVVRSRTTRVLIDPLLFAGGSRFPAAYQPLRLRDVGSPDAVLITHTHRDHLDAASLLQVAPETTLVVPRIERETLLSVAIAERARELGFQQVTELDWWQSTRVGDIAIQALPFYGEQPTDGDRLHPAIRNAGNIYIVRTPTFAAAFLGDSGRDGQGDVKQVAGRARERDGPVDVVFAGYRGWRTYAVQHVFSSVARYVLFVPPWLWSVRQQIMNDVDDAIDVAERWGARYLVPYADGGAPWHWQIGLGPRLDEQASEVAAFDPFPERVIYAARNRSQTPDGRVLGSPVEVLLLRPGDSVGDVAGQAIIRRVPGHAWPYDGRPG